MENGKGNGNGNGNRQPKYINGKLTTVKLANEQADNGQAANTMVSKLGPGPFYILHTGPSTKAAKDASRGWIYEFGGVFYLLDFIWSNLKRIKGCLFINKSVQEDTTYIFTLRFLI